jgi:hypothetical protein
MIHFFALDLAQKALRERKLPSDSEAAKAYLAENPQLLIDAELTLRQAPGMRLLAKRWREAAEAGLRENRALRARRLER